MLIPSQVPPDLCSLKAIFNMSLITVTLKSWCCYLTWYCISSYRPDYFYTGISPHAKESGFVEPWIPGFGIRTTAIGIRNHTNNWNPGPRFPWQRIRNPVSGNQCQTIVNCILYYISLVTYLMSLHDIYLGTLNPGLWNPDNSYRNPKSH